MVHNLFLYVAQGQIFHEPVHSLIRVWSSRFTGMLELFQVPVDINRYPLKHFSHLPICLVTASPGSRDVKQLALLSVPGIRVAVGWWQNRQYPVGEF